jgi:hypothetical protein
MDCSMYRWTWLCLGIMIGLTGRLVAEFVGVASAVYVKRKISREVAQVNTSYHDLHVTTRNIPRTSISNLPYNLHLSCTRTGGWELWRVPPSGICDVILLAGEYNAPEEWLVLDVKGHVIIDSRREPPTSGRKLNAPSTESKLDRGRWPHPRPANGRAVEAMDLHQPRL